MRRSSLAPVFTVPALATTQKGSSPRRQSVLIEYSSASTLIRKSSSTGILRSASLPNPRSSTALRMELEPPATRRAPWAVAWPKRRRSEREPALSTFGRPRGR